MDEFIENIPRYKKKSKKKPPKKSKHKHIFEPCVLEYPRDWFKKPHEQNGEVNMAIGLYCPLCGKVGHFNWVEFEFIGFNDPIPEEIEMELNPQTRTLTTFLCKDPFQKFVDIEKTSL